VKKRDRPGFGNSTLLLLQSFLKRRSQKLFKRPNCSLTLFWLHDLLLKMRILHLDRSRVN
jgi:hypothetical protein